MMENKNKICGEFDSLSSEDQKKIFKSIRDNFKKTDEFNEDYNSRVLLEMWLSSGMLPKISEKTIRCTMIKCGFEFKNIENNVQIYKLDVKSSA